MLSGKTVLLTGGTGSFGKKFVEYVLKNYPDIKRLVIYSRDELKQFEMAQKFSPRDYPALRYFIGDIRDKERLMRACEGIDVIIHAAALKQVPAAEYNPIECIKTNIIGAENLINVALDQGVQDVIALSTDKASAPINLYGATKLCSDKLFVAANNMKGSRELKFSVVRYGNVFGSRGSVVPFFMERKKEGVLPITHKDMTRFSITLEDGVKLVIKALECHMGGEIFVPKIPSYKIEDVAKAICDECELKYVGVRPGEKIHEDMITETDSLNTYEFESHYIIAPSTPEWDINELLESQKGKPVGYGFKYNSGSNTEWLNVEQIKSLIKSEAGNP